MGFNDTLPRIGFIPVRSWNNLPIPFVYEIDDSLQELVSFSSGHGIIYQFSLLMGIDDTLPRIGFIPVRSWNNLPIPFVDGN